MSSRAQVAGEIGIGTYSFERGRGSAIAIFPNQGIDARVFAKFTNARCENNQFCPVRERHPCTVDGLVAQPCAAKFVRIKINDRLLHGCVHSLEIYLHAERGGEPKTLDVIADKEATNC